jgi:hypothetical protein
MNGEKFYDSRAIRPHRPTPLCPGGGGFDLRPLSTWGEGGWGVRALTPIPAEAPGNSLQMFGKWAMLQFVWPSA